MYSLIHYTAYVSGSTLVLPILYICIREYTSPLYISGNTLDLYIYVSGSTLVLPILYIYIYIYVSGSTLVFYIYISESTLVLYIYIYMCVYQGVH